MVGIIIKSVFTTLQIILMLTVWFSYRNKKDIGMALGVIIYLMLITGAMWL